MATQTRVFYAGKSTRKRTLADPLGRFLLRCQVEGLSKATLAFYDSILSSYHRFVGDGFLEEQTSNGISHYLMSLRDRGLSPVTVGDHYRALRVFYGFLVSDGLMLENPVSKIPKPRQPKRFPHCLEEHQVKALLDVCETATFEGMRNQTMILAFLGTGLRRGELVSLNTDTVNLSERVLRVKGKGDKERLVCFGPRLVRVLRTYMVIRASLPGIEYQDALFVTGKSERLKNRNVHLIISRLGKKAGITGVRVSPHSLRHTFATRYIANGGDPYALQELLGHSDPKTTMVYVHMTGRRLKEAFAKADPLGDMD